MDGLGEAGVCQRSLALAPDRNAVLSRACKPCLDESWLARNRERFDSVEVGKQTPAHFQTFGEKHTTHILEVKIVTKCRHLNVDHRANATV